MGVNPNWFEIENGACLVFEGTDITNVANRVAFIEKTPRIRIAPFGSYPELPDAVNWAAGPKGTGPDDDESRKWCLQALRLHGYELPDVFPVEALPQLWRYQMPTEEDILNMRVMHPFTCPNRGDGRHVFLGSDRGMLVPTVRGWICPCCDYTQAWAHDFMMEPKDG